MKETHTRSLVKGITWRITGTVDTIVISWLITGNIPAALKIGAVEVITKIFLFYVHERVWGRINWGRKEKDSHRRSFVKGISWRVTGTVDTIIISWFITGHFPNALKIGGIEVATKLILYYLHERLWMNIRWGKSIAATAELKSGKLNGTAVKEQLSEINK